MPVSKADRKYAKSSKSQKIEAISHKAEAKRKVRLDELKWKSVELPDRLDDYEGFYGLEEVDDVDIIRDATTGIYSYQTPQPRSDATISATPIPADVSEDDFAGFSDTADQLEENTSRKRAANHDEKDSVNTKRQKKTKTEDESSKSRPNDTSTSAFAAVLQIEQTESTTDISAWQSLQLSPDTLAALARLGFSQPSAIQSACIPEILDGRDVVGKASTGSGKTLAFGIPIFESFLMSQRSSKPLTSKSKADTEDRKDPPLALIVSPTRELAHQLAVHLNNLAAGLPQRKPVIATLTGGLSIHKQQRVLTNADIVIGTPGRLWEIMSGGIGMVTWLRKITYLVIDEADRLLSHGNFKELEQVLKWLDQDVTGVDDVDHDEETSAIDKDDQQAKRQTLVFSATFDKNLQQKLVGKGRAAAPADDAKASMEYLLTKLKFRDEKPKYIDVNPHRQMAGGLKEGLVECAGTEKDLYLYAVLLLHQSSRSLVFVNSISAVRRLVPFLQNLNLGAVALHSQMPQKARLRSIEHFTNQNRTSATPGKALSVRGSILVATDVAARGLDIPQVQLVVHYHLPRASDTYVHRSGRTARAGESGSSILICGPEEVAGVRRLVGKTQDTEAGTESSTTGKAKRQASQIRHLNIDRRIVARLKPRAALAKQLADVSTANEKKSSQTELFKSAAEDLGVEYDSEEMEANDSKGKRGRGAGRIKKEREARSLSKDEVRSIRAELNQLLKHRVNVGVSERYLTSGTVDIDELLRAGDGATSGDFLGLIDGTGLDD